MIEVGKKITIKSDSSAPITLWGRDGFIESISKEVAYVKFYDGSMFITNIECLEEKL